MATQEEWYQKLKGWVPTWFFATEENNEAVYQGFAKVLEAIETSGAEHVNQTYIAEADGGYLQEHGNERNVYRQTGELDVQLSQRIRNIVNSSNKPALEDIVNALLDVGTCVIQEDWEGGAFFSQEYFFNRGEIVFDEIYNAFSIIVDKQVHAPYSFYTREYFGSREDFIGTNESSLRLFELIIEAVNRAKALGTVYRLIEGVE